MLYEMYSIFLVFDEKRLYNGCKRNCGRCGPIETISWTIAIVLWLGAFVGLIYPILPSSVLIFASFLIYGWLVSFAPFNWLFWVIQGCFFLLLFIVDYVANALGIKKFGGTKASMWGSTIGLLAGPFIIPFAGIILGPFIGAVLGEMIVSKTPFRQAVKIGLGSVAGFIGSVFVKGIIMAAMIIYFIVLVL